MLNIPVEIKEKLKTNTAAKNFRVTFPNGERADIINDNIVFESVRFTESVMSQNKFKLGLCESPVIEFEVFNIENIKGKKIECFYEIYCDNTVEDAVYREDLDAYVYPIPLGVFYVDSCKKEAKMNMRQVIAYGEQAYFEWKIPEGTCFNTGGNPIDISVYLALALQSLDVVDVTSTQDMTESSSGGNYGSRVAINVLLDDDSSVTTNMLLRDIVEKSVFIDYVSTSTSEKSMTLNVSMLWTYVTNISKKIHSNSYNYSLFTFDTVSKVKNADAIKDYITGIFNLYAQTYRYRTPNENEQVTHINFIYDNPTYYTQHYAYNYPSSNYLQDTKYALIEDFSVSSNSLVYVWNNSKTQYQTWSGGYMSGGIVQLIHDLYDASYSQARANLISAWETVTYNTWENYGEIAESDWANGENNVLHFGEIINFTGVGYSINNYESLTRDELQKYAENILETQGKLGRFDRNGVFEAFTIDTDTLVPNNTDLVPSESLVPNGADVDTIYPSEYESAWYDDELSLPYGACSANHKVSGTDTYTIVYADGYDADTDPSTYQIYDISDNDLIKEMTVEEITPILTTIITNISNLQYMPSDIDMVGRPDIEAGDGIQVLTNPGTFNTYVLSRTTDGIQGLSDTITAK